MTIVAVSEDAARATGRGLEEVTQAIVAAETGRLRGLIAIDPRLKEFIKDHHDMDSILTKLAQDMKGQAIDSTDTYAVSVGRLNSAWTSFKEDVGSWLLPWLAQVIDRVGNMADQIHIAVGALGTLHNVRPGHEQLFGGLVPGMPSWRTRDYKTEAEANAADAARAKAIDRLAHPDEYAARDEAYLKKMAEARHRALSTGIHLEKNTTGIGEKKGSGAPAGQPDIALDFSSDDGPLQKAAQRYKEEQDERAAVLAGVTAAIKLTTSAEGEYQAQIMALNVQVAQATVEIIDLTKMRDNEKAALDRMNPELKKQKEHLLELVAAKHQDHDAITNAQTAYNQLESNIKKVRAAHHQHSMELKAAQVAQNAMNEAIAAGVRQIDAYNIAENDRQRDFEGNTGGSDSRIRYWQRVIDVANAALKAQRAAGQPYDPHDIARFEAGTAGLAAVQNQTQITDPEALLVKRLQSRDALATYGVPDVYDPVGVAALERERTFYAQRLEYLKHHDEEYAGERQAFGAKLIDLDQQIAQKRIDYHDQFLKTWQDRESSILQGVLTGKTSLRDGFKALWNDVFDDMAKALSDKLVHGALFKRMNDELAKLFGVTTPVGTASGDAAAAKALASVQTRTLAEDHATTATTAATTALGNFTAALDRAAAAAGHGAGSGGGIFDALLHSGSSTGGSGGADGKAGFFDYVLAAVGGGAVRDGGSKDGINIDSIGGKPIGPSGEMPTNIKSFGGASVSGALQGLMIAQIVNGITGGNSTWGSAGGALGGAFGGPVGAAIGAAIGGLFGPHWGPASNYPDRSDPTYRGWLDAFNSGPGGGGDHVEKMIAAIDPRSLSGQQLTDYNTIKGWEGGTGQLGIKDEHDGFFTLVSGLKVAVSEFRSTIDRFVAAIGTGPASSSLWNLVRTYPQLDISTLQANGTYTPTTITQTGNGNTGNTGNTGNGNGNTGNDNGPDDGTGRGRGGGNNRNINGPVDTVPDIVINAQLVLANGDVLGDAVFPRISTLTSRQSTGLVAASVRSRMGT